MCVCVWRGAFKSAWLGWLAGGGVCVRKSVNVGLNNKAVTDYVYFYYCLLMLFHCLINVYYSIQIMDRLQCGKPKEASSST